MAETITDVIDSLTEIIDWSKANSSRLGYYAALYRIVTIRIKKAISSHQFENNDLIAELDVIFARLYLDAFTNYHRKGDCVNCWKLVFSLSKNSKLTILQHLVMGINVHINYDLVLALAELSRGSDIEVMKNDFNKINDILHSLTDDFALKISSIWERTGEIDQLIGKIDKMILSFMMKMSRRQAWKQAVKLHNTNNEDFELAKIKLDHRVTKFGYIIIKARMIASMPFWFRSRKESDNILDIINKLEA